MFNVYFVMYLQVIVQLVFRVLIEIIKLLNAHVKMGIMIMKIHSKIVFYVLYSVKHGKNKLYLIIYIIFFFIILIIKILL